VDQDTRAAGPQLSSDDEKRSPAEIRADIENTREELGDTVEALAAKTDVKARVHDRVEETKTAAREKISGVTDKAPDSAQSGASTVIEKVRANPVPVLAVAALALAFFIGRRSALP
jgi:ElaB/YqjD/DUF883 family membrane-anchored ribosome-binding protein